MNKEQYVKDLTRLARIKVYEDNVWQRELSITIAYDYYDMPSSAIIAFVGSPPRLEVFFRFRSMELIVVGEKILKASRNFDLNYDLHKFLINTVISETGITI